MNIVAGETNVLNLAAAATRYLVRSLRLKSVDPGDHLGGMMAVTLVANTPRQRW